MQGKIIKVISNNYTVLCGSDLYVCKPRGKFRNLKVTPITGDNVTIDDKNNYILEIHGRKNSLVRPPVSNIDQGIIIASVKDPDFSTNLLDKLLTIIEFNNIKPIIIVTKLDLLSNDEIDNISNYINYYRNIGYDVYENTQIDEIKKAFENKISVFTGQSGAGKSTLLNKLDQNLNIKTDEISYALGRGKHTTRHVELLTMYDGLVADTPGFSSIEFNDMTNSDIRDSFVEFNLYKENCAYKDCMHHKEDKCYIKQIVGDKILNSRYENYIKFITRGDK